jgi:hypothetical protein
VRVAGQGEAIRSAKSWVTGTLILHNTAMFARDIAAGAMRSRRQLTLFDVGPVG